MIHPDKIQEAARKKENENFRFRSYLKKYGKEEEIDRQFLRLHKELFADYDCSKCRNCCKMYRGCIPKEDIEKDAGHLGITSEQFIDFFLIEERAADRYQTKHMPCDFLRKDGDCRLGECRPEACRKFPYTDQPKRLWNMLSMLDEATVCPVVYEIFERIKAEYKERRRRRRSKIEAIPSTDRKASGTSASPSQ